MRRAFTLIELLIVVAIIAILAAIAVPNFLEVQVRAKVSRVRSDQRTIATALEAYAVDCNHYPFDVAFNEQFPYYLSIGLSTPVTYLSNAYMMADPFTEKGAAVITSNPNGIQKRYRYRAFSETWCSTTLMPRVTGPNAAYGLPGPTAPGNVKAQQIYGKWFVSSKGPDRALNLPNPFTDGNATNDWLWLLYDSTNGTNSRGELSRGQNGETKSFDVVVNY